MSARRCQAMVLPTYRHRIILRPEAEIEGLDADAVLRRIVAGVPVPVRQEKHHAHEGAKVRKGKPPFSSCPFAPLRLRVGC